MPIPLSLNVRNCVDFINLFFISVAKMLPIKWNKRPRHSVADATIVAAILTSCDDKQAVLNVEKRITHTVR